MKNILCWRKEFFLVGIIFFLILMMSACSNDTTNYSETGDDTHRTEQTGITTALTAIIDGIINNDDTTTPVGSLDTSFGTNGITTTAIGTVTAEGGSGYDYAYSVAVQSDGKIILAGTANNERGFALARYNANGSLDPTFNSDGMVITTVGMWNSANSVAIQGDGKIVAAGRSSADSYSFYNFALVRYDTNGSLDPSFDSDGIVVTALVPGHDYAYSVAIQADGKIVAAGTANNAFALARYNPDGSLDGSFDGDGIVTTELGSGADVIRGVAIQADGKIVAAGYSNDGQWIVVARYNANGSLDSSFGGVGYVLTAIGTDNYAYGVAIQPDGKIVIAGWVDNDFAVVRYNADGSLDSSFDGDGIVTTAIGTNDRAYGVAIQPDAKIIAAGSVDNDFAVVRYNADGSLDTSFDGDGIATTVIGTNDDQGQGVVLHDGKIIVGGYTDNGSDHDFALARYLQ